MQQQESKAHETSTDLPLTLWLQGSSNALFKQSVIREAKKQWIISAHWGERDVIAKVFTKLRAAQSELKAIQALEDLGIKTPALLHHGWLSKQPCYVLIFEKVEASNLDDYWWHATEEQQIKTLSQLILTLAKLHSAGLKPALLLADFLINQSELFLLSSVKFDKTTSKQEISENLGLKNLAFLMAQLSPNYDESLENYYSQYIKAREMIFKASNLQALKKNIASYRKLKMRRQIKKRNDFIYQRSLKDFFICDAHHFSENMKQLLKNPDGAMEDAGVLLKAGDTCTVAKIVIDEKYLVIKRYNIKNFWHGFKRAVTPSRAIKCWHSALRLMPWRLNVAKPIAILEKRFGPFRSTAYYITEYIPGINLAEFCDTQTPSDIELQKISTQIKNIFVNLDNLQISHGDLKATNILLSEPEPILLDIDAMQWHRCQRKWQRAKQQDVHRFKKNWQDRPELAKVFA